MKNCINSPSHILIDDHHPLVLRKKLFKEKKKTEKSFQNLHKTEIVF